MATVISDNAASAALRDDFNRANEGPPPSASWLSTSFSSGTSQLQVVSNALKRGGAGWGSCAWGTQFGPDAIMVVTVSTVGDFSLILRGQQLGSSSWDGYECLYTSATHRFDLDVITNGSTGASLANSTAVTLSAGNKVGFAVIGDTLSMAVHTGSWAADLLTASAGGSISGAGYVGIWANGTTPVLDDFSAGTIASASRKPGCATVGAG